MTKRSFPDVNVWLALAVAEHPHHKASVSWWEEESSLVGFCRLTQLGLLRLLTTASAMGGDPLTNQKAWEVYEGFLEDSRVRIFPEFPDLDARFRSLSGVRQPSPKLWTDAYLAAYAAANEATLVTFDQAFEGYGVTCRILGRSIETEGKRTD